MGLLNAKSLARIRKLEKAKARDSPKIKCNKCVNNKMEAIKIKQLKKTPKVATKSEDFIVEGLKKVP